MPPFLFIWRDKLMTTYADYKNAQQQEKTHKDPKKYRSFTTQDGKRTYTIKLLGGFKGIPIARRLAGVALPLIGRGADELRNDDELFEAPKTFTEMAVILMERVDGLDVEDMLFNNILVDTEVNGERIEDWDDYLTGNYGDFIELVGFALKENFQSFFTENGLIGKARQYLSKIWVSGKENTEENIVEE